nr:reverse transcriptase domain-containing protein [Tanacetum cinerariifolium]
MKMNTASSSGSGTLSGNTITNPKEDLKGITTRSGTSYQGPTIPTTFSSPVVERETEETKEIVHPTNNKSTKDVQPSVVQIETIILNSEPIVAPIIEPVAASVSAPKPNQRPSIPYDPTSPEVDQSYVDTEGDILLLEAFRNDDPSLPSLNQGNYLPQVRKELKICKAKTDKSSIDEPPEVELKDLSSHLEYVFLEGDNKLPVIIAKYLSVEEKTTLITVLKSHKNSFQTCLSHLEKMLKRCEDANLCLNWEKSHFMVKEGIVLVHKISKNGIEVDKAKVNVIAKFPHPTTVKGIRSFLGHAGFYRRFIKDFSKIARPMTRLLEKDTLFIFSKECVEAFQTLKRKLTEAPILIAPDWDLPFELMCDASDFAIGAVLGQCQEKHFRPTHYASKTMTEAASNYTTTEKDMLAVVYAFEKFRSYVL